jgi:hypothetical protein
MLAANQPIRVNDLQREAGVSKPTLYKNQDIWRRHFEESCCLAASLGVISVGVGRVLPENPSLTPTNNLEKPFELLAARQIVSEMAARARREQNRKQKQVAVTATGSDQAWMDRVKETLGLLPASISQADIGTLRVVIAALRHHLNVAPYAEEAEWLHGELCKVTKELSCRQQSLLLERIDASGNGQLALNFSAVNNFTGVVDTG